MLIRPLEEKDYLQMVILLTQLGYPDNSVDRLAKRYPLFKEMGGITYVADLPEQEAVGFISMALFPLIHRDGYAGRIVAICVDERFRSKGIGRELLQAGEDYCRRRGCVLVEVTTNLLRKEAHRFYLDNGFEETHKRFNKKLV